MKRCSRWHKKIPLGWRFDLEKGTIQVHEWCFDCQRSVALVTMNSSGKVTKRRRLKNE